MVPPPQGAIFKCLEVEHQPNSKVSPIIFREKLQGETDVLDRLKKMKILLIDDDEWIRDSMTICLGSEGYWFRAVETAEDGIAEMKRQSYDILLVDCKLPEMRGLEFLRRIQISYPDMFKMLISSYGDHETNHQAMEMGVRHVIEKPFNMSKIRDSLARMIESEA